VEGEVKPTLFEHIFEIRTRLVRSLAVFIAASLVCYVRAEDLFDFLAAPAEGRLVYTHPVGAMMAYMKLAFMAGFIVSSPFTLYQAFAFLKPALGAAWRRTILVTLFFGYALFGAGVAFALRVLPVAMHFLLSFSRPGLQAMINVDQYFSFVFLITMGSGAAFEMPLLMYFLAASGFISAATLVRHWRLAVMGCLILGAVICPTPDLLTWSFVCLSLFVLYAVSIVVVRWAEAARARRLAA